MQVALNCCLCKELNSDIKYCLYKLVDFKHGCILLLACIHVLYGMNTWTVQATNTATNYMYINHWGTSKDQLSQNSNTPFNIGPNSRYIVLYNKLLIRGGSRNIFLYFH